MFLRSGQKPVPATQVKPGVADRAGPGTNNVPGTIEPAFGLGITLVKVLSPGVIPPRPEKYGTFAWRYPYSLRNVMYSLRHPVKSKRGIPGLERITGVLGEVRRTGDGVGPIDGWQQGEVSSGVIHRAASDRYGIYVLLEPEAVIRHPPGKGLLAAGGRIVKTIRVEDDGLSLSANGCSLAAIFASQVSGKREGHLVEKSVRPVVVFDFNTVVGVDAGAAKLAVAVAQRIFAHAVIVEDQREPGLSDATKSVLPGLACCPACRRIASH